MESWKDTNIVERVINIKDKIRMSKIHSSVRVPEECRKKNYKKETYDEIIILTVF